MKKIGRTLYEIRWYTIFVTGLFAAAGIYGYASDSLHHFLQKQLEAIGTIAQELSQRDNQEASFFWFIFINNAVKSLIVLFSGILLGLLPILFIVVNGMVLGYLFYVVSLNPATNVWEVFVKGILPHGILEIPAILLAAAFGLKFGVTAIHEVALAIRGRSKAVGIAALFKQSVPLSLFLVGVLLIAAFVEAYITTQLLAS